MSFDHFADLARQQACPTALKAAVGLVSGFVDGCTAWSCRATSSPVGGNRGQKRPPAPADEAREYYMACAMGIPNLRLPDELRLDVGFENLPAPSWIGLEVRFLLQTPWYSKDDRLFHVLDNPVRKDRVFGVPFMAAASWKGLLRWSCRMVAGLRGYLEKNGGSFDGWKDPDWILHLFGNQKGEQEQHGALAFFPTWFPALGYEVINPHCRERRAGARPIYYEVVPAGAQGRLRLLYAPLPGDQSGHADALASLMDGVEALLTTYGFSAKRTAGWGTARIQGWTARRKGQQTITADSAADFKQKLRALVVPREARHE